MKRLVPTLVLLAIPFVARAAVEEAAPPPLPTADGTAPAPTPPAPTPARTDGLVRAGGPGQAAAVRDDTPRPFSLSAAVTGGYDSNVLLVDNENILGISSGKDSIAVGFDGKGTWRAVNRPDTRVNLIADVAYDIYPEESTRDLLRYGGLLTGLQKLAGWDPGFAVGVHQYRLDGNRAANIVNGSLGASHIARDWVAIPTFEVYATDYAANRDATGELYALRYRHWFLLEPNNSKKRLEAGLRLGWYDARSSAWSYSTVRPEIAGLYRIGAKPALGTIDLSVHAFYEYRSYGNADNGVDLGNENLVDVGASVDYWTCANGSIGLYAEYTVRSADSKDRDYDRFQVGARLAAAW